MEDENQVVYIFPECRSSSNQLQVARFNLSAAQLNLERIVRISFAIQDRAGKAVWILRYYNFRDRYSKIDAIEQRSIAKSNRYMIRG